MANPTTGYFTKDDSGISQVEVSGEATIEEIYTINGVRHSELQQGLNIVRMSDGTIRKIIRKQNLKECLVKHSQFSEINNLRGAIYGRASFFILLSGKTFNYFILMISGI